jgi:TolA-binding protein
MPYDANQDPVESVPEVMKLKRFDMRGLARVLFWGASAAGAMALVAGTAFSDAGAERLRQAVASVIEPVRTTEPMPVSAGSTQQIVTLENQTRQLAQAVRELSKDRDRLQGRIAILEQGLDDITGTIKKQTAQNATKDQPKETARLNPAPPPPVITAPPTIVATVSPQAEKPANTFAPEATASVPPPAAANTAAIAGPVPLPPTRFANAMPDAPAEAPPVKTRQIGIDIGGAASLEALRAQWVAIKANSGPDLIGLKPAFTVRHKGSGAADYRLVLGPLANSAAALRLCAKLAISRIACRAGFFTVEELAER